MSANKIDNCSVVIRSVGERTEQICFDITRRQITDPKFIHIIRNSPFIEAISRGMDLTLDSGNQYALFLDADVLLLDDALQMMLSQIKQINYPFFMCNFAILDYQFGCSTYAGVHFYNSEYFKLAKNYLDESKNEQRPESNIYYQIALKNNIPSVGNATIVGLHGYEQWYADSYRTMFVRGTKFQHRFDYIFRRLYNIYQTKPYNLENNVLLHALLDGRYYSFRHDVAPIDKHYYDPNFERVQTILGFNEKDPIAMDYINPAEEIDRYRPNPETREATSDYLPVGILEPKPPSYQKQSTLLEKIFKNAKKFYQHQRNAFYTLFKDY